MCAGNIDQLLKKDFILTLCFNYWTGVIFHVAPLQCVWHVLQSGQIRVYYLKFLGIFNTVIDMLLPSYILLWTYETFH